MSQLPADPVEFAKAATARLSAHDMGGFLAFLDPEVEFVPVLAGRDTVTYRGHDGIHRWFADVGDAWAGFRVSLRDFEQVSDTVAVVEFAMRIRGDDSPVEFESIAYGVTVRTGPSGLVRSWQTFANREEAEAAAGAAA